MRRCRHRGQVDATFNRLGVQLRDGLLQRALGDELAVLCVELAIFGHFEPKVTSSEG